MESIGIEQGRHRLGEIVDRARFTGQPTVLTRQGKPAAVVVGVQWFEQAAAIVDMAIRSLERGGFSIGDMAALREARRRGALSLPDRRVVHHKDGDPSNNDPANLELIDPKENLS